MPHSTPDLRQRAPIADCPELIDELCGRDVLRPYLHDLEKINRLLLGYRPLLDWLERFEFSFAAQPLRILDVGCGYGDGLRRIERWARKRCIDIELTGIDLNPGSIALAVEAGGPESSIRWIASDVFAYEMQRPAHLVVSSLFTHHLPDAGVVRFLDWMEQNAELGWFINDLSRASIPYHLYRIFSRIARLHPFVQHDGAVSIARSFVPEDWRRLCASAGLNGHDVVIRGFTPGRLCVSRRKLQ